MIAGSQALLRTEADTPTLSPSISHANASLRPLPYILPISPGPSLAKEHSSIYRIPCPLKCLPLCTSLAVSEDEEGTQTASEETQQ